jgi:hypothetical protein
MRDGEWCWDSSHEVESHRHKEGHGGKDEEEMIILEEQRQ